MAWHLSFRMRRRWRRSFVGVGWGTPEIGKRRGWQRVCLPSAGSFGKHRRCRRSHSPRKGTLPRGCLFLLLPSLMSPCFIGCFITLSASPLATTKPHRTILSSSRETTVDGRMVHKSDVSCGSLRWCLPENVGCCSDGPEEVRCRVVGATWILSVLALLTPPARIACFLSLCKTTARWSGELQQKHWV